MRVKDMLIIKMKDAIEQIANDNGFEVASRQLIEEMAELTQAINKFWRIQLDEGKRSFENVWIYSPEENNIVEEIADVEICIEQLKIIFMIREKIKRIKKIKVDRQLKRISAKNKIPHSQDKKRDILVSSKTF